MAADAMAEPEWYAAVDAATNGVYFFNRLTQEVKWQLPEGVDASTVPLAVTRAQASAATGLQEGSPAPSEAPAGSHAPSHLLDGWVSKADKFGKSWKRRWLVANAKTGTLTWFADNPAYSIAVYHVSEPAKGSLSLASCNVVLMPEKERVACRCPEPFGLKIGTRDREQLLGFPDEPARDTWQQFIAGIATSGVAATTAAPPVAAAAAASTASRHGAGHAAGGQGHGLIPRPGVPANFHADFMLKAAPGWRTWTRRYFIIDPVAFQLYYFDDGPSHDAIALALGPTHPAARDATAAAHVLPLTGKPATEMLAAMGGPSKAKHGVPLTGAVLNTEGFAESEGSGTLAEQPAFTVTTASGRVYRFIATNMEALQAWLDMIHAAILTADLAITQAQRRKGSSNASSGPPNLPGVPPGIVAPVPLRAGGITPPSPVEADSLARAHALVHAKTELITGWLHKSDKRGRRWTWRFWVLRGAVLSYYTDESRREQKGFINLAAWQYVTASPGPDTVHSAGKRPAVDFPTAFSLYLGPGPVSDATGAPPDRDETGAPLSDDAKRMYFLAAESATDRQEWKECLLDVINAKRRLAGIPVRPVEE